jgi:hypothetical protein
MQCKFNEQLMVFKEMYKKLPVSSSEVIEFFEAWGVFPSHEDVKDYNKSVIDNGINRGCFNKLRHEAYRLYGEKFMDFCSTYIKSNNDAYFLVLETWADVSAKYNMFRLHMEVK